MAAGASISTDHLARIEQGRRPVTESVLAALCDVLGLNARQRSYVFRLAGASATADAPPGCGPGAESALTIAQRLIDTMTTAAVEVEIDFVDDLGDPWSTERSEAQASRLLAPQRPPRGQSGTCRSR